MQIREREKAVLILFVAVLLSAGWWFFFHTPLRAATARWQADGMKSHAQLIDVQNYKNESGDHTARQAERERRHAFLSKALPEHLEQGAFLSGLERLALEDHLELQGVKPEEAHARDDGLQELPVSVTASGDYFELLAFLEALDAQKAAGRFVLVRGLALKAGNVGEPLTATIALSVFAGGK